MDDLSDQDIEMIKKAKKWYQEPKPSVAEVELTYDFNGSNENQAQKPDAVDLVLLLDANDAENILASQNPPMVDDEDDESANVSQDQQPKQSWGLQT